MDDRLRNGIRDSRLSDILRCGLFATAVASAVCVYTQLVGPALGPLRLESTTRLLIPLTVVSGIVALLLCPLLRQQRLAGMQVLVLYAGFVTTCVGYGCYMWTMARDGSAWSVLLALLAGQVLGMPLFLILIAVHFVLLHLGLHPVVVGSVRAD